MSKVSAYFLGHFRSKFNGGRTTTRNALASLRILYPLTTSEFVRAMHITSNQQQYPDLKGRNFQQLVSYLIHYLLLYYKSFSVPEHLIDCLGNEFICLVHYGCDREEGEKTLSDLQKHYMIQSCPKTLFIFRRQLCLLLF